MQSSPTPQRPPMAHFLSQLPPQFFADSSPSLMSLKQDTHMSPTQRPLLQSASRLQLPVVASPVAAQGLQSPPQSFAVSLPLFTPSLHDTHTLSKQLPVSQSLLFPQASVSGHFLHWLPPQLWNKVQQKNGQCTPNNYHNASTATTGTTTRNVLGV